MDNFDKIIKVVLEEAHNRREEAGYAGSRDDGGASHLEERVKFFKYGLQGIVPPEWKKYADKLDPEYAEYQRLQKKFGVD